MPSVTADTNIYVSALQFGGLPHRFLDHAAAGDFRLDISDAILTETLGVLRDKFNWPERDLQDAEASLTAITHRVTPTRTLDIIKTDPSDNRILECATEARSDYIVTGDRKHILPLGQVEGIPIVTAAEFLKRLGKASPER